MDKQRAAQLYLAAAQKGLATAQCNLGFCYLAGIGVESSPARAIFWLRQSAAQDYPRALDLLGDCYLHGTGVKADPEKAAKLYEKAGQQNYPHALCSLGLCYEHGRGVPADLPRAFSLYQQAAELGDASAMCNLGFCFLVGIGVQTDLENAVHWLQKAKEAGSLRALDLTRTLLHGWAGTAAGPQSGIRPLSGIRKTGIRTQPIRCRPMPDVRQRHHTGL